MKRFLVTLAVVLVVCAIAGRATARWQVDRHMQQRAVIEEAERAAKIKRFQVYFGDLVKTADEVVVEYDYVNGKQEVRSSDPSVVARLSAILSAAPYKPTSPALWMSLPIVNVYRKHELALSLMTNGAVLRCLPSEPYSEFVV